MAVLSWTLTDVDADLHVDHLELGPDEAEGMSGLKIVKRTLRGGLRDGVEVVEIDNGLLKFTVLLTRGLSLWRAEAGPVQLCWKSPVRGPVHPKFVPLWEPSGIGFLSGFDEFFVRCGLESNGAPEFDERGHVKYPLHGKIANLPAHRVELEVDSTSGEIRLIGEVDEARLFGNKMRQRTTYTTRLGEPSLHIHDEFMHIGAATGEMQLLYHINIGEPFLAPGAQFHAPISKLVPRTPAAAAGLETWNQYGPQQLSAPEQVFFTQLAADSAGQTLVLLENAGSTSGVSLSFNTQQLPYFILWKNPQLSGDGYVTGLEPAINFPNPRSFESHHSRLLRLSPGQTFSSPLTLTLHPTANSLLTPRTTISTLSSTVTPEIHPQPTPDWVDGA